MGGPRLGRALYSGLPNAWASLKVRHKSSRGEEERGEEGAEGAQKKKRKGERRRMGYYRQVQVLGARSGDQVLGQVLGTRTGDQVLGTRSGDQVLGTRSGDQTLVTPLSPPESVSSGVKAN